MKITPNGFQKMKDWTLLMIGLLALGYVLSCGLGLNPF